MIWKKKKKIGVVYFSLEGNTEYVVQRIKEVLQAGGANLEEDVTILKLEPVQPYSTGKGKFLKGGVAAMAGSKPQLKPYRFDPKEYDVLILASPVWAGTIAPPLRTFLLANKLKGQKVGLALCSTSGRVDHCFKKFDKYLRKTEVVSMLSLIDPAKKKKGEDQHEINRFVGEILGERG